MSEWLTRVINENQEIGLKKGRAEGEASGLKKGRAEGRAEGEARGLKKGRAEGSMNTLAALVRKNVITLKEAAEQAEMSEAAFCEKTGLPLPQ